MLTWWPKSPCLHATIQCRPLVAAMVAAEAGDLAEAVRAVAWAVEKAAVEMAEAVREVAQAVEMAVAAMVAVQEAVQVAAETAEFSAHKRRQCTAARGRAG